MSESSSTDSLPEKHTTNSSTENQYEFPGQLTVWEPGDTVEDGIYEGVVPDETVLVEVSTPLQDRSYLLQIKNFGCGFSKYTLDASCIYRTDAALEVIFPIDDSQHVVFRRDLKNPREIAELHENEAEPPETYDKTVGDVIWVAPNTDAAVIEN